MSQHGLQHVSVLPTGGTLPEDVWQRRHRAVLILLWAHVPFIVVFALVRGADPLHTLAETGPVAVLAILAKRLSTRRRLSTVIAALGLLTCSAILVHLSGGVIELHFHFFVMVGVIALYQDWWPFLAAITYVVVQHGVGGALWPHDVYNHPSAIKDPWTWAGIHGLFILGMSAVGIISWRLNEAMQRATLDRERQLLEAQELAHLGSWEWDVQAGNVTWSEELYRIFGVDPETFEVTYDSALQRVHPDDLALVDSTIRRCLETRQPFSYEARVVRPSGDIRWIQARGDVVTAPDGELARVFGTTMDVTERYRLDSMKKEFISVVSHELRTPLTSMRGALGLLADGRIGPLPKQAEQMVKIAAGSTERLVRLINDILDVERIESAQLRIRFRSCSAEDLLARAANEMTARAGERGIRLFVAATDSQVLADPDRIDQTLGNLIENALKFSPRGSTVTLGAEERGGEMVFSVADRGRGIPPEMRDDVFLPFHQVDGSDVRTEGGTGLGLAICKGIVSQHGGRIWVESTPGEGSTFFFTLPLQARQPLALSTPAN